MTHFFAFLAFSSRKSAKSLVAAAFYLKMITISSWLQTPTHYHQSFVCATKIVNCEAIRPVVPNNAKGSLVLRFSHCPVFDCLQCLHTVWDQKLDSGKA